jgi:hypothetical protein
MPHEGYVSADGPYTGLTKDQLLQCAYSPTWVRIRCILLVAYWTLWFAMLAGAITLVFVSPGCSVADPLEWWQLSPMYQVYPLSYQDSNHPSDGVGDIPGMFSCNILNLLSNSMEQIPSRKFNIHPGTEEIPHLSRNTSSHSQMHVNSSSYSFPLILLGSILILSCLLHPSLKSNIFLSGV